MNKSSLCLRHCRRTSKPHRRSTVSASVLRTHARTHARKQPPQGLTALSSVSLFLRDAAAASGAAAIGTSQSAPAPLANGVQTAAHQNGVSANGDFEEIIQLNNGGASPAQTQSARGVGEPILAFEAGDSFRMKTGPMKPQHVAGTTRKDQGEKTDEGFAE